MTDWTAVPDHLLKNKDTKPLTDWLRNRGLQMTLLDLDTERHRRRIVPPIRARARMPKAGEGTA